MAYYFLYPEKDTTVYSHPDRKLMNSGQDELLELVKEKNSDDQLYYPSRILLKFKNEEVKDVINNTIGSSTFNNNSKVSLNLYQVQNENLVGVLNLEAFAVSQSWDEGSGRYSNLPTSSNGASWIYRDNSMDKSTWPTGSAPIGATFASRSIGINQIPSHSEHRITINNIDFIPVVSSSLFISDSVNDVFVDISSSAALFGNSLKEAINASGSITGVSASFIGGAVLVLSGSEIGTVGNVTVTTSSVEGNNQAIFVPDSEGIFDLISGTDSLGSDFVAGTTGSISSSLLTKGGGSWYTGSGFTATQQFLSAEVLDTNFDVTEIIKKHSASLFVNQTYPTGVHNNGFLVKQTDSVEVATSSSFGMIQFFSVDTNTIYPPKLCFKWDDSTHVYQSSAKTDGELSVSLYRNKKEYNQNDIATIRVNVRDKYPTRTFVTSSNYLDPEYFTTSSYYSIRDAHTEEEIIPFDDSYTKMSADSEGMYFKLYMKGLQPERYYRILFKHINNDGTTIYDDDYHFKIVR